METKIENVVIVGSGPAGLTAALYAARSDMNPLVLHGPTAGGQLTQTTDVENFPGYPTPTTGPNLIADLTAQAENFGARLQQGIVTSVDMEASPKVLTLDTGETIHTKTLIIATGASARWLGLDNEARLLGAGVSACATCDGFFFRGRDLMVVGGGDTAMEDALFLTTFAKSVTIVHRRDEFRASVIMTKRVLEHEKISVIWNATVSDILGDDMVTGVELTDTQTGEVTTRDIEGIFIAIGHTPNSALFADKLDTENGYLKVAEPTTATKIPGVFACGDITDLHYRQAITAAGQGAKAAIDAYRWLEEQEA